MDMHCHLLPGIDDGSPDVETSIRLIEGMIELGVKGAIATPHVIGDLYRNDGSTISAAFKLLQNELTARNIDFDLRFAAEYMLDLHFLELLEKKVPLLRIKDDLILTEFSYLSRPEHIEKISFMIQTEGYVPILAHPERYPYFYKTPEIYSHLKDLGFRLQVNLLSLTGYYGKEAKKAAKFICDQRLADFLGTDLHHDRHLAALSDPSNRRIYSEIAGSDKWNGSLV